MEKLNRSRRDALKLLLKSLGAFTLAALPVGFLTLFLSPARKKRHRKHLLEVRKSDLPVRGAWVFREKRLAVVRQEDHIHALSLVCTHLGCTLTATPREFICPCHGSRFDFEGRPSQGPATEALNRYEVERADGSVVVRS